MMGDNAVFLAEFARMRVPQKIFHAFVVIMHVFVDQFSLLVFYAAAFCADFRPEAFPEVKIWACVLPWVEIIWVRFAASKSLFSWGSA